jgi:hypothetical protein
MVGAQLEAGRIDHDRGHDEKPEDGKDKPMAGAHHAPSIGNPRAGGCKRSTGRAGAKKNVAVLSDGDAL